MKILVTGASRSGTNWVTEIVRLSQVVAFTERTEDRAFFVRPLPVDYGTKLTCENKYFWPETLSWKLVQYEDLHVVFCLRHPYSLALANIYRAYPGHDNKRKLVNEAGEIALPEYSPLTVIGQLCHARRIHDQIACDHPQRLHVIRLEELIAEPCATVDRLLHGLGLEEVPAACYEAYKEIRNPYQQARYQGLIDPEQVEPWKHWETAYDGFFQGQRGWVLWLYTNLRQIAEHFGYDGDFSGLGLEDIRE